jgi:Sec-independent protein translocase protein TatA
VNFSISEIIVILLIALLVIKPEQLPDVAFTLGKFAQTLKRMFAKVKEEVSGLVDSVEIPTDFRAKVPADNVSQAEIDSLQKSSELKHEQKSE